MSKQRKQTSSAAPSKAVVRAEMLKVKRALQGLPDGELQSISNGCKAIYDLCRSYSDGAGLMGGILVEIYMAHTLRTCMKDFEVFNQGEADFKMAGQAVSFKKIQKNSQIAMHWSRNPKEHREHWQFPLLLLQQTGGQWWTRTGPKKPLARKKHWLRDLPKGFYIIDNEQIPDKWRRLFVTNNKTNSVVPKQILYMLLCKAFDEGLFVKIPEPEPNLYVDFSNIIHKDFGPDDK